MKKYLLPIILLSGLTTWGIFSFEGTPPSSINEGEVQNEQLENITFETISQSEGYSTEFSFKIFQGGIIDIPDNSIVYRGNFSREINYGEEPVWQEVFRQNMIGVKFVCTRLDNVFVPDGNFIINEINGQPCGSHNLIQVQNDLEDWVIDGNGEPIEPINKDAFLEKGISIDPDDIPNEPLETPITQI